MTPTLASKRGFVFTLGMMTAITALTVDLSLPAVPAMVHALETELSAGQQIVGIFIAGMAVGQIPSGLISDRIGRMPVIYFGLGLFAIAACIAAAASSIELMLVARFVQGMGASSAVVISRAIVRDVAHGKEAARIMSVMTMILTAAPVFAPSIGALLVTQWTWRAPFITIAVAGFLLLLLIRSNLAETHTPDVNQHPVRQLRSSFSEFFSHRQSIFGLLLLILQPAGYISLITISAALTVEIYGFSVQSYGVIFAIAGLSILAGAMLNRNLVQRFDQVQLVRFAVVLIALSATQLLIIGYLDHAPFWWLWTCVCLYMFTVGILMPNATIIALDPLPRIAGVASSIIGTLQNTFGAAGALISAMIYDGSVHNAIIIMSLVGGLTMIVFALRRLIAPDPFVHNPKELARG